jgi:hypothetical protein
LFFSESSVPDIPLQLQGFEWYVPHVQKLKEYIEGRSGDTVEGQIAEDEQEIQEREPFEILKHSPMIGDDKFKLEIGTCPLLLSVVGR